MNDKEFDDYLKTKFKENWNSNTLGEQVDNIVGNMFQKRRKKKRLILMAISAILTSTTVLAITYNAFNLSSIGIDDSCLQIANENGYIQTLNIEEQYANGLGIKLNEFLIDDINMDISFEYRTDKYNISDIKDIFIQDLIIYDNDNNLLYKEGDNQNYISQTMGYTKIQKLGKNSFKNTFFAQSDSFPNSKELYIEFTNVILNCKKDNISINGNWKFKINVSDKMIYRKNIMYRAISNNNNGNITIKDLKLTNTGLIANIVAENSETLNKAQITAIINGKKYKTNNNVFEKDIRKNKNYIEQIYTFNLTKYDLPEEIKIRIKEQNIEKDIIFIKYEE